MSKESFNASFFDSMKFIVVQAARQKSFEIHRKLQEFKKWDNEEDWATAYRIQICADIARENPSILTTEIVDMSAFISDMIDKSLSPELQLAQRNIFEEALEFEMDAIIRCKKFHTEFLALKAPAALKAFEIEAIKAPEKHEDLMKSYFRK